MNFLAKLRRIGLAAIFSALTCAASQGAESIEAAQTDLDRKYATLLGDLAKKLEAAGDRAAAKGVRQWPVTRAAGRRYAFLPPAASGEMVGGGEEFRRYRTFYAKNLFQLARQAAEQEQASIAYLLVFQVLREDPNHAQARALLDYQREGADGPWLTAFAARQRNKGGLVEHEVFGWLPKEHVAKYDEGSRFLNSRWVSVEEEDRVRGANIQKDGWKVVTEHYVVRTNHSLEAGVALGRQLEELHAVWRQLFAEYWFTEAELKRRFEGKASAMTETRHNVWLFRNKDEYVDYLKRDEPGIAVSLGYYAEKPRTAYFYAGDEHTLATQFHEATHQLFHERQRPGARPAGADDNFWVVEGIATYMESLQRGDGYFTIGGVGANRLQFARYRALTEEYYVPLARFVTLGREEVKAMGSELPKVYSQAAGLVHFFMDGAGGKYRDALVQYLDDVYRDKADATTLSKLTGKKYDELDAEYLEFLRVNDDDLAGLLPGEYVPRLYLGRTRITDKSMKPIAGVTGLEQLDVGYCGITDAGVKQLPAWETIEKLSLEHTRITDASLAHIGKMTSLRELDLSGCRISNASLAHLANLKNLEILWLTSTPITDAGLEHLHGLTKLKFLDTEGTNVTANGWVKLKQAVPAVSNEQ